MDFELFCTFERRGWYKIAQLRNMIDEDLERMVVLDEAMVPNRSWRLPVFNLKTVARTHKMCINTSEVDLPTALGESS